MGSVSVWQELSMKLFMRRSAQRSMIKNAVLHSRTSAIQSTRRSVQRILRQNVRWLMKNNAKLFRMRSVRRYLQSSVELLVTGSAPRFLNKNAGMSHVENAKLFTEKNVTQ